MAAVLLLRPPSALDDVRGWLPACCSVATYPILGNVTHTQSVLVIER